MHHNSTIYATTFTPLSFATAAQGLVHTACAIIMALPILVSMILSSCSFLRKQQLSRSVYIAHFHDFNSNSHRIIGVFDNVDAALDALQTAFNGRVGEAPGNTLERHHTVVHPDEKGTHIIQGLDPFRRYFAVVERMTVRSAKF